MTNSYWTLRPVRILTAGFHVIPKGDPLMTTTRRSNFSATIRTTILLAGLGGLLVVIGALVGGAQGATGFLIFALLFNLAMYFFSDKIALRAARAQPVSEEEDPRLYQMVRELTTRAGVPMPKLYVT